MTLGELYDKVQAWDSSGLSGAKADSKYHEIMSKLEFFAKGEWRKYYPAEEPDFSSNYMERLAHWVGNADKEADQRLLLEYATYISFFSHDDIMALYKTAMQREIMAWILQSIVKSPVKGDISEIKEILDLEVGKHTWYCPVSDSMQINQFYKVNRISGVRSRPVFMEIYDLFVKKSTDKGNMVKEGLLKYMKDPGKGCPSFKRLVLLEDVVGSGSQCIEIIKWTLDNLKVPLLFIPLIICPKGVKELQKLESDPKYEKQFSVRPVIQLKPQDLLGPGRKKEPAWPISENLEAFIELRKDIKWKEKYLKPYGFSNTGGSFTTVYNTPNNTIPIIHGESERKDWSPLFPRVTRD